MADPVLLVPWPTTATPPMDELAKEDDPTSPFVTREWLATNGLGGYASGTVATIATRRFHGLLIAALPPPLGRTMLIAHASETERMLVNAIRKRYDAGPNSVRFTRYADALINQYEVVYKRPESNKPTRAIQVGTARPGVKLHASGFAPQ